MDQITGQVRYTGGVPEFMDGLKWCWLPWACLPWVSACTPRCTKAAKSPQQPTAWTGAHDTPGMAPLLAGLAAWHFLGFPFGTIPAGGTEIPTFLSYGMERKLSKHQHEFGTVGAIEGVAGPEAANNAAVTATLVPLLTLGIPTSVTAAILLSALQELRHQRRAAALPDQFPWCGR
jgi:putative tricarboxylic transport membrane protein